MAKHAYEHAHNHAHVRAHGRHRRPRTSRPLVRTAVAAGGLTGGVLVAGAALAPVANAATADDFARLRGCESGGNYQADTGNGFYGAYQFALGTWQGLGYSGRPSDAAPSTQDAAARQLQSAQGWSQWPVCAAALGLGSSSSAGYSSASSSGAAIVNTQSASTGAMSVLDAAVWRSDVRALQADLRALGYRLVVDGHFGPETDKVVRHLQTTAGITVDGVAGPQTLRALSAAKAAAPRPTAAPDRMLLI